MHVSVFMQFKLMMFKSQLQPLEYNGMHQTTSNQRCSDDRIRLKALMKLYFRRVQVVFSMLQKNKENKTKIFLLTHQLFLNKAINSGIKKGYQIVNCAMPFLSVSMSVCLSLPLSLFHTHTPQGSSAEQSTDKTRNIREPPISYTSSV